MFEGFILAGGRSSRMGRDKASIEIGGLSLLERTIDVLRKAGASQVRIVMSEPEFPISPEGIGTVRDQYRNRGALGGIHAALSACGSALAFVSACDLPFANARLAGSLLEAIEERGADCAVPEQTDGRLQPLFAVYRREPALSAARELLESAEASGSTMSLIDRLECRVLRFTEYSEFAGAEHFLMNVNTPEELAKARRLLENRPPGSGERRI